MDYRIISIGTLSQNEFWNEPPAQRTPHATTTLIRSKDRVILVDPGLPATIIAARLKERAGIGPEAVTEVFLTNFRPAHRRGLEAFPQAAWLVSAAEREVVGKALVEQYRLNDDEKIKTLIGQDIALLKRCTPAPDRLAEHVDLFPLPGFTPGTCGLLLSHPNSTTLVAGDAIATSEHLDAGRVQRGSYDMTQALESFTEAVEIADAIIPAHDNLILNPSRRRL
jgi:glyoxylase-like metal-dependent hydrolase (beta-lactamase superfamily II)